MPTSDETADLEGPRPSRTATTLTRRRALRVLFGGAGAIVVGAAAGYELIEHKILPGKTWLAQIDGACSVGSPPFQFGPIGQEISGTFASRARRRDVGYTIGLPADYHVGDTLPLIVMLHGFHGSHVHVLTSMSPAQAVALLVNAQRLRPMALVTVDGGNGYWNPHPHDDPMAMVVDELIPMMQRRGLGVAPHTIGLMGISMGGYGALAIAERHRGLAAAVAAISPAVWTSYPQARSANAGAFASAQAFAAGDVIAHAKDLAGVPVRVASGYDDPFYPGVQVLANALPRGATVVFGQGCHTGPFFHEQEPPSLSFLSEHLV